MEYQFICYGHENITAKHKNTFEITSDNNLSLNGDCIVGIKADYDINRIKPFLKFKKLKLTLLVDNVSEIIEFLPNTSFFDTKEIVIRIGNFISDRTLGVNASKASIHFDRNFVKKIANSQQMIKVIIQNLE